MYNFVIEYTTHRQKPSGYFKMVYFNVEMQDNINMRKDNFFFCAAARYFGLRAVFGIFWPEGGRRPSEGQKNPKNGLKAKMTMPKHKTFFVIPNDEKCRALTHELHFSTLSKFFPLQKVNFPVPKIPLGKIYFLSLLARKTRTRARMKKRAKGRKFSF